MFNSKGEQRNMERNLYNLSELIKRWECEDITTEQAIGQILLWLTALAARITKLEANTSKVNNVQQ